MTYMRNIPGTDRFVSVRGSGPVVRSDQTSTRPATLLETIGKIHKGTLPTGGEQPLPIIHHSLQQLPVVELHDTLDIEHDDDETGERAAVYATALKGFKGGGIHALAQGKRRRKRKGLLKRFAEGVGEIFHIKRRRGEVKQRKRGKRVFERIGQHGKHPDLGKKVMAGIGVVLDEGVTIINKGSEFVETVGEGLEAAGAMTGNPGLTAIGAGAVLGGKTAHKVTDEILKHEVVKKGAEILKRQHPETVDHLREQANRLNNDFANLGTHLDKGLDVLDSGLDHVEKFMEKAEHMQKIYNQFHAVLKPDQSNAKTPVLHVDDDVEEKEGFTGGMTRDALDQAHGILTRGESRKPVSILEPSSVLPIVARAHEAGRNLYHYGREKRDLFNTGSLFELPEHAAPLKGDIQQKGNADALTPSRGVGNRMQSRFSPLQPTL